MRCEELEGKLAEEQGRRFVDMETWCRLHGWEKNVDRAEDHEAPKIEFERLHEKRGDRGEGDAKTDFEKAEEPGRVQCCPDITCSFR